MPNKFDEITDIIESTSGKTDLLLSNAEQLIKRKVPVLIVLNCSSFNERYSKRNSTV